MFAIIFIVELKYLATRKLDFFFRHSLHMAYAIWHRYEILVNRNDYPTERKNLHKKQTKNNLWKKSDIVDIYVS